MLKNLLTSGKLWDVFTFIEGRICQEAQLTTFFVDTMNVLECNQRLLLDRLIDFEDCIIFFSQALTNVTENYDYFIDCKVINLNIFA